MRPFLSNIWRRRERKQRVQQESRDYAVVSSRSTNTQRRVPERRSLRDFKGDPKWQELSQWGRELGVSTWTSKIVSMPTFHANLFMGSRLSVQNLIDGKEVVDQYNKVYNMHNMQFSCVASQKTCHYCDFTSKGTAFNMRDRNEQDSDFLNVAVQAAENLHRALSKGNVLVHCHSGRNRSALIVLVYAAMYTNFDYNTSLSMIKNYNASRFPRASTLINSSFTRIVEVNWDDIRSNRTLVHRRTAYGSF